MQIITIALAQLASGEAFKAPIKAPSASRVTNRTLSYEQEKSHEGTCTVKCTDTGVGVTQSYWGVTAKGSDRNITQMKTATQADYSTYTDWRERANSKPKIINIH